MILEKLTDGESCIFCDPTQQEWRNVSAGVERDGGTSSIRMTELLVRPALPDLGKAEPLQDRDDLARLEYRHLCHKSRERDTLSADKLAFKHWFSIFQEHFHHFAKVRVELVQRVGLRVGSRESGNVAHVETGLRILFDNRRVLFHGMDTSSLDPAPGRRKQHATRNRTKECPSPEQVYILAAPVNTSQHFYAIRCRIEPGKWWHIIAFSGNYGSH